MVQLDTDNALGTLLGTMVACPGNPNLNHFNSLSCHPEAIKVWSIISISKDRFSEVSMHGLEEDEVVCYSGVSRVQVLW